MAKAKNMGHSPFSPINGLGRVDIFLTHLTSGFSGSDPIVYGLNQVRMGQPMGQEKLLFKKKPKRGKRAWAWFNDSPKSLETLWDLGLGVASKREQWRKEVAASALKQHRWWQGGRLRLMACGELVTVSFRVLFLIFLSTEIGVGGAKLGLLPPPPHLKSSCSLWSRMSEMKLSPTEPWMR